MLGAHHDAAWAGPMVTWQGISLVNISQAGEFLVTGVPQVAVSRVDPNLIAVAWRKYGLPINTNAGANPGERTADCHVAVSTDGGQTFTDTDLMPILRQRTDPEMPTQPEPGLYYCNWPWVSIGDDRTIYAGGAMFTALGDIGWPGRPSTAPKQGRASVTTSRDDGRTWSQPTLGIKISHFAPGLTGLGCSNVLPCVSTPGGTDQWHTPWDNAMGVAASGSTTFYSKAGSHVVASAGSRPELRHRLPDPGARLDLQRRRARRRGGPDGRADHRDQHAGGGNVPVPWRRDEH